MELEQKGIEPADRRQAERLAGEKVTIDRKVFYLDLQENHRGRFLKVTEDLRGNRHTVMIPASGFRNFAVALLAMVEVERRLAALNEGAVAGDSDTGEA